MACRIEAAMMQMHHASIRVSYLTTSNAGSVARARRILARRHPHVLTLLCQAETLDRITKVGLSNNTAGTLQLALEAVTQAILSTTVWYPKIREEVHATYGSASPADEILVPLRDKKSDWLQHVQPCLASQLRIQSALQNFAKQYDLPPALQVWGDFVYWNDLSKMERMLTSVAQARFIIRECEGMTLAHVMLVYGNLWRSWSSMHNESYHNMPEDEDPLLVELERQWHQQTDHHLFLLAFLLMPQFHSTALAMISQSEKKYGGLLFNGNPLCFSRMHQAAEYYFIKYQCYSDPEQMEREVERLHQELSTWMGDTDGAIVQVLRQVAGKPKDPRDVVEFWARQTVECAALKCLAMKLLGAPVRAGGNLEHESSPHYPGTTASQTAKLTTLRRDFERRAKTEKAKSGDGDFYEPNHPPGWIRRNLKSQKSLGEIQVRLLPNRKPNRPSWKLPCRILSTIG